MRELLVQVILTVAYDGSAYRGWQDNGIDPSIERCLRIAIERIQRHSVILNAASRTDAGVHAEGQVVGFYTTELAKKPESFLISLNALLPLDIRAVDIATMPLDFHPTLNVSQKIYSYRLCYHHTLYPLLRHTTWHCPGALNMDTMYKAAELITGEHDFSAFCNNVQQTHYESKVRSVDSIRITEEANKVLVIDVAGKNFLYKMVRNIVGTLVYVGNGKLALEQLRQALEGGDRAEIGMTAPAHGLCLKRVIYKTD